jgi:P27 family predicted phage terminase small subunit
VPGPRPKPTHLKIIAGNPGGRPLNRDEPEPDGDLLEPPPSFANAAKPEIAAKLCAVWRECIGNAPAGLLKNLDTYTLEQFCRSVVTYRNACAKVEEAGEVIRIKGGQFQKNPFLSIADQQSAIMQRLSDQLGFSPAARTRVKISGKKKAKSALRNLRELQI